MTALLIGGQLGLFCRRRHRDRHRAAADLFVVVRGARSGVWTAVAFSLLRCLLWGIPPAGDRPLSPLLSRFCAAVRLARGARAARAASPCPGLFAADILLSAVAAGCAFCAATDFLKISMLEIGAIRVMLWGDLRLLLCPPFPLERGAHPARAARAKCARAHPRDGRRRHGTRRRLHRLLYAARRRHYPPLLRFGVGKRRLYDLLLRLVPRARAAGRCARSRRCLSSLCPSQRPLTTSPGGPHGTATQKQAPRSTRGACFLS